MKLNWSLFALLLVAGQAAAYSGSYVRQARFENQPNLEERTCDASKRMLIKKIEKLYGEDLENCLEIANGINKNVTLEKELAATLNQLDEQTLELMQLQAEAKKVQDADPSANLVIFERKANAIIESIRRTENQAKQVETSLYRIVPMLGTRTDSKSKNMCVPFRYTEFRESEDYSRPVGTAAMELILLDDEKINGTNPRQKLYRFKVYPNANLNTLEGISVYYLSEGARGSEGQGYVPMRTFLDRDLHKSDVTFAAPFCHEGYDPTKSYDVEEGASVAR